MILEKLFFTSVFELCNTSNLGVSGFSYRIFFICESSQLSEFSTDLKDYYFIILGTGLSSHEPVNVVVVFQYLIKRRTIFLRHPIHSGGNYVVELFLTIEFTQSCGMLQTRYYLNVIVSTMVTVLGLSVLNKC